MIKQLLTTTLLAVLSALYAGAQDTSSWSIVDAAKPDVALAAMNDVAFLMTSDWDDSVAVVCKDGTLHGGLAAVTFRQLGQTAVSRPVANKEPALYGGQVGQTIVLTNCKAGTAVTVYSLSGQKLLSQKAAEGKTEVAVGDLTDGVYLLKVGEVTIKFQKGRR